MDIRSSPSGKLNDITPLSLTKVQNDWLPASGNSQLFVLMSAGHEPGIYSITSQLNRIVAAGAGSTATRVITYSTPELGNITNTATGTTIATTGPVGNTPINVVSDGVSAITVQWQPVGTSGNPRIDIYSSAALMSQGV